MTPDLVRTFKVVNRLVNTLAYNPPGSSDEGFLFWASWVNHLGPAIFSNQDAQGPIRRGLVVIGCQSLQLLENVVLGNPQLGVLVQLLEAPDRADVCPTSAQQPGAGCRLMQKAAPSFGRIALMVGFALSCFGLVLFLWLAFGGPGAAQAEGLPGHGVVRPGVPARDRGRRADLRRPGRQGQGDRARREDRPLDRDDRAQAEVRAAAVGREGDAAAEDAARRDLRGADAGHERRAEGGGGRRAARGPDRRDGRARRDPAHVRSRDPRGVPGVDADAGRGDRRPRPRHQRRARQPRPVRGGRVDARRHPQPPGARGHAADLQHRRGVRGADRAQRPAARPDRELQHGVRDDGLPRPPAAGGVRRAADVRARVARRPSTGSRSSRATPIRS